MFELSDLKQTRVYLLWEGKQEAKRESRLRAIRISTQVVGIGVERRAGMPERWVWT